MRIGEAWELFEEDKRLEDYSRHTLAGYKLEMTLFSRHVGDIDVEDVTTDLIKEYIMYMKKKKNWKASTIEHKMKSFRSIFAWLSDNGYIENNPTKQLKNPKQDKTIPRFIREEKLQLIFMNCESPLEHAMVRLLYDTACRVNELCAINREGVDFTNRSIIVSGKGSKEREVYFSIATKLWLERYLDSRDDLIDALFVTERKFKSNGGQPRRVSNDQVRWIVKRISKRAGIKQSIHPHRFRHTQATRLLSKSEDIELVGSYLGHASLETTKKYAKYSGSKRRMLIDQYL